jgi:antitoxin (DNA-binding transcriptional repressor) of toxin-antitoxin stability system
MRSVNIKEAQSQLPTLIQEIQANGESVTIVDSQDEATPLARLFPAHTSRRGSQSDLVESFRKFRSTLAKRLTIDEIVSAKNEGRKY